MSLIIYYEIFWHLFWSNKIHEEIQTLNLKQFEYLKIITFNLRDVFDFNLRIRNYNEGLLLPLSLQRMFMLINISNILCLQKW